ncbi:hypothetical protein P3L10_024747 [Capsicum annuum]
MSVREYSLRFNSLSRYAPNVVATMDDRVHQYVDRLDPYLKMEDQRQRRRTQELERGYSKRARSTGQFMTFERGFRPQFSARPPRPLSSYFAASAPPQFQGSRGN